MKSPQEVRNGGHEGSLAIGEMMLVFIAQSKTAVQCGVELSRKDNTGCQSTDQSSLLSGALA